MASSARAPSLLLVLLPGLVLALIGARAVLGEIAAGKARSEGLAASAGRRIARAAEGVVEEQLAVLPRAGAEVDDEEIAAALASLYPRWVVDAAGRTIVPGATPAPAPGEADVDTAASEALVARAEELGELDPRAGAALAGAGAQGMNDATAAARLHLASAGLELSAGRTQACFDEALDALARASIGGSPALAELAARALGLAADAVAEGGVDAGDATRLVGAYEFLARDRLGVPAELRADALDRVERALGATLPEASRELRVLFDDVRRRAGADDMGGQEPAVVAAVAQDALALRLFRPVRLLRRGDGAGEAEDVLVGGQIPTSAVRERIEREAAELVNDGSVLALRLVTPDGIPAVTAGTWASRDPVLLVSIPLGADLAGWSVEALPAAPDGVPPTAVVLGLAAVLMTLALVAGAVSLRRAAQRQAQLAEDRRTFLDHVAHEVRTPAAALLALSEELDSGNVPAERTGEYVKHLHAESKRLARLVEETLDLARLDSGRLAVRREPVDLCALVLQAVDEARQPPDSPGTQLAVPDDELTFDADERALGRSIRNLVENALRHSGTQQPVEVALEARPDAVRISVRDHGRGIAPEHQARLFERFYRVPSPTHETKGVGLGLALCKEVVEAHGGSVEVESSPGRGAAFIIHLPR